MPYSGFVYPSPPKLFGIVFSHTMFVQFVTFVSCFLLHIHVICRMRMSRKKTEINVMIQTVKSFRIDSGIQCGAVLILKKTKNLNSNALTLLPENIIRSLGKTESCKSLGTLEVNSLMEEK